MTGVNLHGVRAIYRFEMNRAFRTWMQSLIAPVLTTALYFIVFGSAIGSRMGDIGGVSYGAYIIPGLLMLSLLSESISKAAGHPAAGDHAAYLSGWGVLQHQHAATVLADRLVVQPGGLSHQRAAVGVLWPCRRAHRGEHQHDLGVHGPVPRRGAVGVQDGPPHPALSAITQAFGFSHWNSTAWRKVSGLPGALEAPTPLAVATFQARNTR